MFYAIDVSTGDPVGRPDNMTGLILQGGRKAVRPYKTHQIS